MQKEVKASYMACAVIFGADETLLNIKLVDGFSFERLSLIPRKDHINDIFDTTDFGLRRDYETARIDENSLDVICAVKKAEYHILLGNGNDDYYEYTNKDLVSLDNQIRMIRLFYEGPIRFMKMATVMKISGDQLGEYFGDGSFTSVIPIGEAMITDELSKLHLSSTEVAIINAKLSSNFFPLQDEQLNFVHKFFDLSYHTDGFISITLLITALEMLFLNEEQGKKERLSKRCACFISEQESDITQIYTRLKEVYRKRCDFVHDGEIANITTEDILFLRECTRKSLIRALEDDIPKDKRIQNLKLFVEQHKGLFQDVS